MDLGHGIKGFHLRQHRVRDLAQMTVRAHRDRLATRKNSLRAAHHIIRPRHAPVLRRRALKRQSPGLREIRPGISDPVMLKIRRGIRFRQRHRPVFTKQTTRCVTTSDLCKSVPGSDSAGPIERLSEQMTVQNTGYI